jgi:hypothetical protein
VGTGIAIPKWSWPSISLKRAEGRCTARNHLNQLALILYRYPQPHCGQQLRITSNGHSEIATVVDTCPGCKYGDLDMSPALFQHFNDLGVGRFKISWSWELADETQAPEITSTSSQQVRFCRVVLADEN